VTAPSTDGVACDRGRKALIQPAGSLNDALRKLLRQNHDAVAAAFPQRLLNLQGGRKMRKAVTAAVTATFFVVTSFVALAASAFEGVWKVKDTAGHPFEITLSSDGAAKATRGEGMTGTWKEEGSSAVITWNTGWTTKITKEGDRYIKAAYRKGQSLAATPTNTSEAEKAK
jgi:hypothetical protein